MEANDSTDVLDDGSDVCSINSCMTKGIMLLNSRSIVHIAEILSIMHDTYNPMIIGITESWLKKEIQSASLGVNRTYDVIRRDRNDGRRGGGVCMLIRKGIHFIPSPGKG